MSGTLSYTIRITHPSGPVRFDGVTLTVDVGPLGASRAVLDALLDLGVPAPSIDAGRTLSVWGRPVGHLDPA